jgi:hypothetical protein
MVASSAKKKQTKTNIGILHSLQDDHVKVVWLGGRSKMMT